MLLITFFFSFLSYWLYPRTRKIDAWFVRTKNTKRSSSVFFHRIEKKDLLFQMSFKVDWFYSFLYFSFFFLLVFLFDNTRELYNRRSKSLFCTVLCVLKGKKTGVNAFFSVAFFFFCLCSILSLSSFFFSMYANTHILTTVPYFLTTQRKNDDNEKLERIDNKMRVSRKKSKG